MVRLAAAAALALLLTTPSPGAEAQPGGRMPRIGFLGGGRADGQYLWDAFREGLRERGYLEGQNIVIEWRFARGRDETFPALAAELVRLGVDLIVVGGGPAIRAAMSATTTIPIVMAVNADPVGAGLVASLARPGGNVTGLSILAAEGAGKRLELLREVVSGASRVTVVWNPATPGKIQEWQQTQAAARAVGVTLHSVEVLGPTDIDRAFVEITGSKPDALLAFADPLLLGQRQRLVAFARKARLALVSETREFAESGALLTYGASLPDLFRRAGTYVDKILKGARPADLPVEQPTKFELVVNLKTARALGVTIPPSLRLRADRLIE